MKNKFFCFVIFILSVILVAYCYINKNQDKVFAYLGDYYFKKNEIQKAQNFYEKAFDLGFDKSKQREIYVNSIINSPLTVEAQEKLIKFYSNPKEDVAKVRARYFINDLRREIHRKYPYNYIKNAVHNQKIVRWGKLPITYSFVNGYNAPDYFIEEVEKAFMAWEKATGHQLLFSKVDDNSDISIRVESTNPAKDANKKYVVAYTYMSLNLDKLKNMEIKFYLKDPKDKYYSRNQIYNTALHEIVHALGFMGHCKDDDNLMYLAKDTEREFKHKRASLGEADINTVKLLYKIKPEITNIDAIKSEYVPFVVLGEEDEVNDAKIKEALLYVKKVPNLPIGYIDLAEGYVAIKDYKNAMKNLEIALSKSDTKELRAMVYFNMAITCYYEGDFIKAHSYLLKSISIKDTNEKKYLLGEIYESEGNIDKAIEQYSILINRNPNNPEYVIALANIYVVNREFLKARKVLKHFFKNHPSEKTNPRFEPYGILKFGL